MTVFFIYVQPYFSHPAILSVLFYLDKCNWELLSVWSGRIKKQRQFLNFCVLPAPHSLPQLFSGLVSFCFEKYNQVNKAAPNWIFFFITKLNYLADQMKGGKKKDKNPICLKCVRALKQALLLTLSSITPLFWLYCLLQYTSLYCLMQMHWAAEKRVSWEVLQQWR